jgi:hypothetical protein
MKLETLKKSISSDSANTKKKERKKERKKRNGKALTKHKE